MKLIHFTKNKISLHAKYCLQVSQEAKQIHQPCVAGNSSQQMHLRIYFSRLAHLPFVLHPMQQALEEKHPYKDLVVILPANL